MEDVTSRKPPSGGQRFFTMTVASVYPLYRAKIEKKGRTVDELDQVICWLSGYHEGELRRQLEAGATFREFFAGARLTRHGGVCSCS